jgi:hypothetical protein
MRLRGDALGWKAIAASHVRQLVFAGEAELAMGCRLAGAQPQRGGQQYRFLEAHLDAVAGGR